MKLFTSALSAFRKVRVFCVVLFSVLMLCAGFIQAQEGTRQVMPPTSFTLGVPDVPANGTGLLLSKNIGQGSFLGAATVNAYKENRIYFNITDATTEKFYFGVKPYNRPFISDTAATTRSDIYYKIYDSASNNIVKSGGPLNSSDSGWINNYTEAYNGPRIGGFNTSGYKPALFTPTVAGDYYIVFYPSSDGGATELANPAAINDPASAPTIMTFFDFSVVAGTTFKPGRVYCRKWSFIAYQPDGITPLAGAYLNQGSELISSVGSFYSLTTSDKVINRIEFRDGFRPLSFVLAF
ncbi:MAG: hypothetical protein JWP88_1004, partial [Flaviaesturariibacter sp.]|nr:hypothetical protein [Flaviaesturariibacter sp.]